MQDQRGFWAAGRYGKSSIYAFGAKPLGIADTRIAEALKAHMGLDYADVLHGSDKPLKERIDDAYRLALSHPILANVERKGIISYMVAHDTAGYGPFSMLLDDAKSMEEIMVDKVDSSIGIYHTKLGYCKTNLEFDGLAAFRFNANKLIEGSDKELSEEQPIVDAQLMDRSRVHAQLKPIADGGGVLAIRLNGGKRFGIDRLISEGTASSEMLAYMWMTIEVGYNVVIAGAPATGKTSMLLSLLSFVPRYNRVIIIEEEANELTLSSNFIGSVNLNGTSNGKGANMEAQVVNALHLRPDRLVIGELRGPETRNVFSSANLGVPFMTTMHSNINEQALVERLTTKPMSVEPEALHSLDVALFMRRTDLYKRSIDRITEYKWITRAETEMEKTAGKTYEPVNLFAPGALLQDGLKSSKVIERYAESRLITARKARLELSKRVDYLDDAVAKHADMDKAIQEYG
jgi:flagellar protein FlaI